MNDSDSSSPADLARPAEGESAVEAKPARRRRAVVSEGDTTALLPQAPESRASGQEAATAGDAGESNHEAAGTTSHRGGTQAAPPGSAASAGPDAAQAGQAGEGARGERGRRRSRRDRRRGEARSQELPPGFEGPMPYRAPPAEAAPAPEAGEVFSHVLSGQFDTESEPAESVDAVEAGEEPVRRILAPEPDAPKLHKVLAQAGIGSRRDLEDMIAEGRITVNDEPAHTGQRISFGDRVAVDGEPVRFRIAPPPARIIAYHKPAGEIVSNDDPQNRPTVFRQLPRLQQGKWQSVGRLDINTEGLLLFTNSGGLANQLMHPRFGVEREYAVRVMGTLDDEARSELLEGVEIDGQRAAFKSIEKGGGEGLNQWYRVVITEGRNREVRRLFEEVGFTVSRQIRIRYGTVELPHGLTRGVWTDLDENDVRTIRRLASGNSGERAPREDAPRAEGPGKRRENRDGRDNRGRGPERQRPPGPRRDEPRFEQPPRQGEPVARHVDHSDDPDAEVDHGPIPNPLQQTFDHRFVQGRRIGPNSGFGAGGSAPRRGDDNVGGPKQPDPLQTSVGYIGADAFHRKNRGRGKGGGGGGGGGG